MMKSLLALAAISLFAIQPAAAECDTLASAFAAGTCEAQLFDMADAQLSQTIQRRAAMLSPAAETALQRQQSAWVAERDHICTTKMRSGTFLNFSCAVRLTNARIAALQVQFAAPVAPESYDGQYLVAGTAMPWLWTPNGINSAFQYSIQDGTGPTRLSMAALHAKPGQTINVHYLSGTVSVGASVSPTDADGTHEMTEYAHAGQGSTGRYLASQYITPLPVPLGELLGAFTDKNGALVTRPFAIGDGPALLKVPPEAEFLQFGTCDDLYADNTGTYTISVTVKP